MNSFVDYLNRTTVCTIVQSKLGGVGVIAIQDIEPGTLLSEYTFETLNMEKGLVELTEEEFSQLIPPVRSLILSRILFTKGDPLMFIPPNHEAYIKTFMNHSYTPNSNGYRSTTLIPTGEEITFDYTSDLPELHPLSKEHMHFLWT